MNQEQIIQACKEYKTKLPDAKECNKEVPFSSNDEMLAHCSYMCDVIISGEMNHKIEKSMRWLGFIQGCISSSGLYTIAELKSHNFAGGTKQEKGIAMVAKERLRHSREEGFDENHDLQYKKGELADYAKFLLTGDTFFFPKGWDPVWKEKRRKRTYKENLVKIASLIVAEIDLLNAKENGKKRTEPTGNSTPGITESTSGESATGENQA